MRNRQRMGDEYYKPQPLRPVFEGNELQSGIWLEIIPHKLKMVVVEPGTGPNPKVGDFVRVKHFIYLDNMTNVKQDRATYTFGRNKMIPGLEFCLALTREGFKGRFYIDSSLAYGSQSIQGIPSNSNLVMDVQVSSITPEPVSAGEYEDHELVSEILRKAEEGDQLAAIGNYPQAQRCYEYAFARIQSTRCKEIKNYLYSRSKITYMINNGEKTEAEVSREITEVVRMYEAFDLIKIKAVEAALLNRDFYRVIILSRQCAMETRLEQNQRILAAKARAYTEVGEFKAAIQIIQHLSDVAPDNLFYQSQLERIKIKQKDFENQPFESAADPILALSKAKKSRRSQKKKGEQGDKQEDYEAGYQNDLKEMRETQAQRVGYGMGMGLGMGMGMGLGMPMFRDFSYFQ